MGGAIAGCGLAAATLLGAPVRASAYSALAHEAIIDAAWGRSIQPALRARFHPTLDELKRARAFAYGGSLIQDIGYYPFSSYAELVERLAQEPAAATSIPGPLLAHIRAFYADPSAPIETKKHKKEWIKLTRALDQIKAAR